MTEKTGYKYSIKFNQSLTSGTIAFEGFFAFDSPLDFDPNVLVSMLKEQETAFQKEGYKAASSVPNNMKQLPNAKDDQRILPQGAIEAAVKKELAKRRVEKNE